jgi:hypothetical protein
MQKHNSTNWKSTATLAMIGMLLTGFGIEARSQTTMCAKFVGDYTAILGSDLDSTPPQNNDHKAKYCDGGDVVCGSKGSGFVFMTDYHGPSKRKAWIDLKSATQYNNPMVPATLLPRGNVEIELTSWTRNNLDGTCNPNPLAPLSMAPGDSYIAGLRIWISDGANYYDLRFGQTDCAIESSGCPVIVTAGVNLDGDGLADIWTIEPAAPEATAILFKSKSNGVIGAEIGYFQVPFTLVFTKAEFASVLDSIP